MYEALGAIYLWRDVPDRVDGVLYRKEPEARGGGGGKSHLVPSGSSPVNETLAAATSTDVNCHPKKESSLWHPAPFYFLSFNYNTGLESSWLWCLKLSEALPLVQ